MTVVRRKGEDSLKVALFALVFAWACTAAVAAQPAPLLVGAVRDADGRPIAGATVTGLAGDGTPAGQGLSDAAGTFAVPVSRPAATVEVSCRYCVTRRVPAAADPGDPVVVIVRRFHALSDATLSQRDLQVLPYYRPSGSLGLLPYLMPVRSYPLYGDSVSDRGLNLGYALVLDQGAPTYDMTGYSTAFTTIPDRATQRVDFVPANLAYRYGSYAGGGTFNLETRGDPPGGLSADVGQDGTIAGYLRDGNFAPAAAESFDADDGAMRRRAGLDYESNFMGGVLRVGAVAGSQSPLYDSTVSSLSNDSVHAAYATASRNYRTFAELVASQTLLQNAPADGDAASQSSAVAASLRIEHPAAVTTDFGLVGQHYTGGYSAPVLSWPLNGLQTDYAAYVEAHAAGARASFDAATSLTQFALETNQQGVRKDYPLTALLPSVSGRYDLGGGFALRASASDSFRAATLIELAVAGPGTTAAYERGSLFDAGVQYDDAKRLRLDAMAFQETLNGFVDRNTTGLGAAVTWQVSPLVSLRAWTLHDAADQTSAPLIYVPTAPTSLSRGVLWASYDNPGGIRLDAILHRDLANRSAQVNLDGDVVVPVFRGIAATFGTSQTGGNRSFRAGLRLP